jgi:hypothetical protein
LRCYAALNVDAVVLVRHERPEEAVQVAEAARHFETEWRPLVAELASEFDLADFEAFRSARNRLAHALAPATDELERLHAQLVADLPALVNEEFVRIGEITEHWATLQVVTQRWAAAVNQSLTPFDDTVEAIISKSVPHVERATARAITKALEPLTRQARQLAVDAFLPRAASLQPGDLALLRIERSGGTSLLSLLAAVQDQTSFALNSEFTPYFSDEPLPSSVVEHVHRQRADGNFVVVPALTIPLAS